VLPIVVGPSQAVELGTLLLITEYLVGLVDLFESVLRRGLAPVAIRVVLERQLAIGLLDIGGARIAQRRSGSGSSRGNPWSIKGGVR
jgi:hypothetical protein